MSDNGSGDVRARGYGYGQFVLVGFGVSFLLHCTLLPSHYNSLGMELGVSAMEA